MYMDKIFPRPEIPLLGPLCDRSALRNPKTRHANVDTIMWVHIFNPKGSQRPSPDIFISYDHGKELIDPEIEAEAQIIAQGMPPMRPTSQAPNGFLTFKQYYCRGTPEEAAAIWNSLPARENQKWRRPAKHHRREAANQVQNRSAIVSVTKTQQDTVSGFSESRTQHSTLIIVSHPQEAFHPYPPTNVNRTRAAYPSTEPCHSGCAPPLDLENRWPMLQLPHPSWSSTRSSETPQHNHSLGFPLAGPSWGITPSDPHHEERLETYHSHQIRAIRETWDIMEGYEGRGSSGEILNFIRLNFVLTMYPPVRMSRKRVGGVEISTLVEQYIDLPWNNGGPSSVARIDLRKWRDIVIERERERERESNIMIFDTTYQEADVVKWKTLISFSVRPKRQVTLQAHQGQTLNHYPSEFGNFQFIVVFFKDKNVDRMSRATTFERTYKEPMFMSPSSKLTMNCDYITPPHHTPSSALTSANGRWYYLNDQFGCWPTSFFEAQTKAPWPAPRPVNPDAVVQHSRVIAGAVWPPSHHLSSLDLTPEPRLDYPPSESIAGPSRIVTTDTNEMVSDSDTGSDVADSLASPISSTDCLDTADNFEEGSETYPINVNDTSGEDKNFIKDEEPAAAGESSTVTEALFPKIEKTCNFFFTAGAGLQSVLMITTDRSHLLTAVAAEVVLNELLSIDENSISFHGSKFNCSFKDWR
ncbi:hypothetical protein EV368DRAFT_65296 [Lentinula lateritia]|nr:hypothetical protein EV368DRAFT_65296 [Lentinula lateritia]